MTRYLKPRTLYLAGLGLAAALTVDLWRRFRRGSDDAAAAVVDFVEIDRVPVPESIADLDIRVGDDLTEIKGIGPTYAGRLKQAGILTYEDVANASPAFLHEVTKATGTRAGGDDWIKQAEALID